MCLYTSNTIYMYVYFCLFPQRDPSGGDTKWHIFWTWSFRPFETTFRQSLTCYFRMWCPWMQHFLKIFDPYKPKRTQITSALSLPPWARSYKILSGSAVSTWPYRERCCTANSSSLRADLRLTTSATRLHRSSWNIQLGFYPSGRKTVCDFQNRPCTKTRNQNGTCRRDAGSKHYISRTWHDVQPMVTQQKHHKGLASVYTIGRPYYCGAEIVPL